MMRLKNYSPRTLKGDLLGGFTAALVALPMAMSFGMAAFGGLAQGVAAGMYGAVFCGILSCVLGGTPAQITGPTGVMTLTLVSLFRETGAAGMALAMLTAALIQILIGLLRLGKYIHLIPRAVVLGFTSGVGVLIILGQRAMIGDAWILALICAAVALLFPLVTKAVPASLVALAVGIPLGMYVFGGAEMVGALSPAPPVFSFPLPGLSWSSARTIFTGGLTLALLGSMESLMTAVVLDGMTKSRHNSNRELIGQGIGNALSALFGGIIGAGVIARSAVNVNAGGRTRISGVFHGIVLLVIYLAFGSYAAFIPKAALGGILVATGLRMIAVRTAKEMYHASKSSAVVIAVTAVLTVAADLTLAVAAGTLLAMFFFVYSMAGVSLKKYDVSRPGLSRDIVSYTIEGPLFFGVTNAVLSRLEVECMDAEVIVLNLMNSPVIDTSGALALREIRRTLEDGGKRLVFAGVKENQCEVLIKLGVLSREELEGASMRVGQVLEAVLAEHSAT